MAKERDSQSDSIAVTLQDIIAALCDNLDTAFGCDIWPDEAEQGLSTPCFFVRSLQSGQTCAGCYRRKRTQSFMVQYHPPEGYAVNAALLDMAEKLYGLLEYIRVSGGLYRGTGMRHTAVDGVLHFLVDYNVHLLDIPQEPAMENLSHDTHIRTRT